MGSNRIIRISLCLNVYVEEVHRAKKEKKIMKENSCEPENLNFMKLGMLKQSQASASQQQQRQHHSSS